MNELRGFVVKASVFVSSMSIRYKIAGALVAVLCLAIASLGLVSFQQQKKTLEAEMTLRAQVLAQQLAGPAKQALLTKDDLALITQMRELQRLGVARAAVLDSKGRVFAKSFGADAPRETLLEVSVPLTTQFGGKLLTVGAVQLALSRQSLLEAIARQKAAFFWITSGFVLLGLMISFALGRVLTRRIVVLMTGMKIVAQGNLNQTVAVGSHDEIGSLAETFNTMILGLREKLHMEKYLSTSTLQLIKKLREGDTLKLGGERRHVAVLFSDIRGFTSMTESLDPEEVVAMLNIYLNLQAEVVYERGGVVDKFVGDEVMAIFTGEDAEFRAAMAAQEILDFVKALNETRDRARKRTMWVGIGLNAGGVIMANMGSERQMDYTAIGDPINTAARLCSNAQPGQAVMSRAVADAVGDRCKRRPLPPVPLKGKKAPVELFELLAVPGAGRGGMRRALGTAAAVKPAGLDETISVLARDLSRGGCSLQLPSPLAEGARVEVSLALAASPAPMVIRGTVRHVRKEAPGYVCGVEFEGVPLEVLDAITEWVHHVDTRIGEAAALPLDDAPAPPPLDESSPAVEAEAAKV